MAGKLIPVLPKRTYDFSNLRVGTVQQIVVAERVDISRYIDCVVAARVNSVTVAGSNSIKLDVYADGHTGEEPGLQFGAAAPFFSSVSLSIAPFLVTYGGSVRGDYATVVLTATRGQVGTFNITLSADLVLRCPNAYEIG